MRTPAQQTAARANGASPATNALSLHLLARLRCALARFQALGRIGPKKDFAQTAPSNRPRASRHPRRSLIPCASGHASESHGLQPAASQEEPKKNPPITRQNPPPTHQNPPKPSKTRHSRASATDDWRGRPQRVPIPQKLSSRGALAADRRVIARPRGRSQPQRIS